MFKYLCNSHPFAYNKISERMFLFGGEILNTIDFKFYLNYADYDSIQNRRLALLQTYQTTKEDLIRCAYTVGLSANLVKLLLLK